MARVAGEERRWGARTAGERRDGRRAALMRSAIKLYGEFGFRNVSVKAVCQAAQLTERYFYESFDNGEGLLRACFLQVTHDLLRRMRDTAASAGPEGIDRVRAGLRVYFGELRDHPAAARVFLVELGGVGPASEALVSNSLDEFGALLVEVLRPDAGSGGSPLLLRGVVGGGLYIARAWISGGYAVPLEEAVEAALRLYGLIAEP